MTIFTSIMLWLALLATGLYAFSIRVQGTAAVIAYMAAIAVVVVAEIAAILLVGGWL